MDYQAIIDFIKALYPAKEVIALHEPSFTGNEKKYVAECIDSTYVSSVGPFVARFEEAVAEFVGAGPAAEILTALSGPRFRGDDIKGHRGREDNQSSAPLSREQSERGRGARGEVDPHSLAAVACMNGTAALHLALVAAGVKPGDRVITQPLSFIATANPIVYCGAEPVFVDVDEDTMGMSPKALRAYLGMDASMRPYNGATRIAAVVPMHTFGNPCRIDEIVEICKEFGIPVIEDAAESIGSYYKGKHTGTFGQMGVLSFNGNKTITTGGGGMVITDNQQLATVDGRNYASLLKHLSTQAKIPHPWEFSHDAIAYNYRLPNINAALGVAQMETIEQKLASKREVARLYAEFFAGTGIRTITEIGGARSNFWLSGIFLENKTQRDKFLQLAVSQNVHCRPAWNLLPTLRMYAGYHCEAIPNAVRIWETLVNLPSSPLGHARDSE